VLVLPGAAFMFLPGTDSLDKVSSMLLTKFIPYFWATFSLSALSSNVSSSIGLFKGMHKKTYNSLFEVDIEAQKAFSNITLVMLPTSLRQA